MRSFVMRMLRGWPAVGMTLLLGLAGCGLFRELGIGGDDPQWAEQRYRGITSSSALQFVQIAVQDRYPPRELDTYNGRFESSWIYGKYDDRTHQALRQRVRVETASEGDSVLLRLRVQQETSPSAGRVASRESDDWELADDDLLEATKLLTKVGILMRDVAVLVEPTAPAAK